MELRIKSGSENKELKFEVGLVDRKGNGDENKITYVAPNDWQPISIPLKKFDNKIKKSEIEYIKIGFLREHGSGTICIDKIELR